MSEEEKCAECFLSGYGAELLSEGDEVHVYIVAKDECQCAKENPPVCEHHIEDDGKKDAAWEGSWHCPYCGADVEDVRDIDDTRATLHCKACGIISEITQLEAR